MRKLLLVSTLLTVSAGCTSEHHAKKLLTKQGYTEVDVTGYDWFACSKDDWFHTGFKAKSPTGEEISGTVCKGLITKSATIRFD